MITDPYHYHYHGKDHNADNAGAGEAGQVRDEQNELKARQVFS